jgi:glycosyltransferase involved in cell wall biosynthesis
MDRPLISYIVVTYQQENYISEAIESALAQSYTPLEIIITDDCSSDRTYEIIEKRIKDYHGPHAVRINRNRHNLGIGGNVNRAVEMCSGEFVVGAAGDDVSLPNRADVICKAWEESDRQATSIYSSYYELSKDGDIKAYGGLRDISSIRRIMPMEGDMLSFLSRKSPAVFGSTHAWSPKLFNYFGPLTADLEDLVLSFRTLAIGKMIYINEPLVKYRKHENNVSFHLSDGGNALSFEERERRLRWTDEKTVRAYENIVNDIETLYIKGKITDGYRKQLIDEAYRISNYYKLEKEMMDGNIINKIGTLSSAMLRGDVWLSLRFAPRVLPLVLYKKLYMARNRLKSVTKFD